eukprot:TRINITY_DN4403_c0_g1_i3.p2 TRINITY_DN4403_c0_g1~~TRINITY_DN4403_c0_g1_i3.p2  ORF type:complete len:410 (+),score=213.45 TRINITY_DN4403_c0_g1_i3:106-1335(+)
MRRAVAAAAARAGARGICGQAPVLHFPKAAAESKDAQVARNTAVALELLRAQLGEKPEPYTRKYTVTIAELQKEIEDVLKSCGQESGELQDGKELTSMQVIERVLRHGVLTYLKNEGQYDWAAMEKWLVYTATDGQEFNKLKRSVEDAAKYKQFQGEHGGQPCLPELDWAAEYAAATDREAVAEKRRRYDAVAASTFERNEATISATLAEHRKPTQDKLLDTLVDQVSMFKPFLAKQVIQTKLIERNADGQLSFSRFVDWNPDARDIAELETETAQQRIATLEPLGFDETYKRYAEVRMRTKEEVLERMDRRQQELAASSTSSAAGGAEDSKRAALMAEILKLQTRGAKEADAPEEGAEEVDPEAQEAAQAAAVAAKEKEMERYRVSPEAVKAKGLIGLQFLDKAEASA